MLRHNNPAEPEARQRVRKRDVSFGPRSVAGARAWDVWQSVVRTTRVLGQNVYEWVLDRLMGKGQVPRLGEPIKQRAEELHLGWSWGLRPRPSGGGPRGQAARGAAEGPSGARSSIHPFQGAFSRCADGQTGFVVPHSLVE